MKYEIPAILRAGGGSIVNNSSVGGLIGLAGMAIYNATKHGVLGMTKSAAIDYAKKGIRINAVCPGIIQTEMAASSMGGREAVQKLGTIRHPIGRAGESEDVADAVLWLCAAIQHAHRPIDRAGRRPNYYGLIRIPVLTPPPLVRWSLSRSTHVWLGGDINAMTRSR